MGTSKSYVQILNSSAIVGGAAGITMLLGAVRLKFAAILISTTGFGLLASLMTLQGLLGTIAGLGIQSSAVRAIAAGKDDDRAIGRAILTLRRICWVTGLTGMAITMALSPWLSRLAFGNGNYTDHIAVLGIAILLANISGGQIALIQGMRRIGYLAKINIFGALVSTLGTIGFYLWLGQEGIVPALIFVALANLVASWHYSRRLSIPMVELSWKESVHEAGGMVRLGASIMWSSVMMSLVGFAANSLITHQISLQAVGIYGAAYMLSGVFVNFILSAMGADYYPRLCSVSSDKSALNRLINEQTEIGVLLAVPGMVVMLTFAPWVIHGLYSSEFLPAAKLLQWFILGCMIRVVQWPMGYLQQALGKASWFFFTQTTLNMLHLVFIVLGLMLYGLEGVSIAFFATYVTGIVVIYQMARRLTGFEWDAVNLKLFLVFLPIVLIAIIAPRLLPFWPATLIGGVVTLVSSFICLRGLVKRVGNDHPIVRLVSCIPGVKALLSLH